VKHSMQIDSANYIIDEGKLKVKYFIDGKEYIESDPTPAPYMFVPRRYAINSTHREMVDLTTFDTDELVYRYNYPRPSAVKNARLLLERRGIPTYEADVLYRKNWMRDNDIICGNYPRQITMDTEEMDVPSLPDVATAQQPIIAIGVIYNGKQLVWTGEEKSMLEDFFTFLQSERIQMIKTWNGKAWDWPYLIKRVQNYPSLVTKVDFLQFRHLDLSLLYRISQKTFKTGWSLEKVGKRFLNREKPFVNQRMGMLSKEQLKERVLWDAEITDLIDSRVGQSKYSDLAIELAKMSYIFPDETVSENPNSGNLTITPVLDQIFLKQARISGFVLPCKQQFQGAYQGAVVLETEYGIFSDVLQFDFSSLYPNIMLAYKIAPYGKFENFWEPIIRKFLNQKELAKKLADKAKYWSSKIASNSLYGIMASKNYRFDALAEARRVAAQGRTVLLSLKDFLPTLNYYIRYGDTDSTFIPAKYSEKDVLSTILNTYIAQNFSPNLKLEFAAFWDKIAFTRGMDAKAVKKRYFGRIKYNEKGELVNTIEIVGLESMRNDWCELAQEIQEMAIHEILNDVPKEKIMEKVYTILDDMYAGKLDSKLVLEKHLKKDISQYKVRTQHLKAYLSALESGWVPVDMLQYHVIRYYLTRNGPKLVNLTQPSEIDYGLYWAKQIAPILYRLNILDELPKYKNKILADPKQKTL